MTVYWLITYRTRSGSEGMEILDGTITEVAETVKACDHGIILCAVPITEAEFTLAKSRGKLI